MLIDTTSCPSPDPLQLPIPQQTLPWTNRRGHVTMIIVTGAALSSSLSANVVHVICPLSPHFHYSHAHTHTHTHTHTHGYTQGY